jgi:DNA-binding LytR/AlgR family response regulator
VEVPAIDVVKSIVEVEWQVHRSIIVRAAAIHRIEANEDGRRQQRLKGIEPV